jgi:endonuclease G
MGNTGVAVPTAFYKVILDMTPPIKMIGFIVPNQTSKRQLASFAVPVDKVEAVTGWDFFCHLDDSVEDMLEADCSFESW